MADSGSVGAANLSGPRWDLMNCQRDLANAVDDMKFNNTGFALDSRGFLDVAGAVVVDVGTFFSGAARSAVHAVNCMNLKYEIDQFEHPTDPVSY